MKSCFTSEFKWPSEPQTGEQTFEGTLCPRCIIGNKKVGSAAAPAPFQVHGCIQKLTCAELDYCFEPHLEGCTNQQEAHPDRASPEQPVPHKNTLLSQDLDDPHSSDTLSALPSISSLASAVALQAAIDLMARHTATAVVVRPMPHARPPPRAATWPMNYDDEGDEGSFTFLDDPAPVHHSFGGGAVAPSSADFLDADRFPQPGWSPFLITGAHPYYVLHPACAVSLSGPSTQRHLAAGHPHATQYEDGSMAGGCASREQGKEGWLEVGQLEASRVPPVCAHSTQAFGCEPQPQAQPQGAHALQPSPHQASTQPTNGRRTAAFAPASGAAVHEAVHSSTAGEYCTPRTSSLDQAVAAAGLAQQGAVAGLDQEVKLQSDQLRASSLTSRTRMMRFLRGAASTQLHELGWGSCPP